MHKVFCDVCSAECTKGFHTVCVSYATVGQNVASIDLCDDCKVSDQPDLREAFCRGAYALRLERKAAETVESGGAI